jgi:hypothetical protein
MPQCTLTQHNHKKKKGEKKKRTASLDRGHCISRVHQEAPSEPPPLRLVISHVPQQLCLFTVWGSRDSDAMAVTPELLSPLDTPTPLAPISQHSPLPHCLESSTAAVTKLKLMSWWNGSSNKSTCLASARPRVQTPVLQNNPPKKTRKISTSWPSNSTPWFLSREMKICPC